MKVEIEQSRGSVSSDGRDLILFDFRIEGSAVQISNLLPGRDMDDFSLLRLEEHLFSQGFEHLVVDVEQSQVTLVTFLLKHGYAVASTDDGLIQLSRDLKKKKDWRISLTPLCNYKCFFCHEEGLDMSAERPAEDYEAVYELMRRGVTEGLTDDITFTGGEPLLRKKQIISFLHRFQSDGLCPQITIGTNGVLIDDELLNAVSAYPGPFKFNLSVHAVDPIRYAEVTRCPKPADRDTAIANMKKIKARGLTLKLNFVLLKGINHAPEEITEILNFALQVEADCVKFLELLVTEQLKKYYPYYYEVDAVREMLGDDLTLLSSHVDRHIFRYRDTALKVELQRCPCKIGCSNCQLTTGRMMTAELQFHPCFILDNSSLKLSADSSLVKTFARGDEQIMKLARDYGERSPIVISKPKYFKSKQEYYYRPLSLPGGFDEVGATVYALGYRLKQTRFFEEIYFGPAGRFDLVQTSGRVVKLAQNSYNLHEYTEIIQKVGYGLHPEFHAEVEFLRAKPPASRNRLSEFADYYRALGLEEVFRLNWQLQVFTKDGDAFSAALNPESGKLTFMSFAPFSCQDVADQFQLVNIGQPLLHYLGVVP